MAPAENLENYLPKLRPVGGVVGVEPSTNRKAGFAGNERYENFWRPPKILKTIFPSSLTWAGLAGLAGGAIYSCKIDHWCSFKERMSAMKIFGARRKS